jgi:hypothetical protein
MGLIWDTFCPESRQLATARAVGDLTDRELHVFQVTETGKASKDDGGTEAERLKRYTLEM